jgi:hypothetical protein
MAGSAFAGRLGRFTPPLCRAFAYFSAVALGGSLLCHVLRHSTSMIGLFEDDFYYYVVIVDHLLTLGKLTFDGITLTNGFHPLWFVLVLLLRLLTGGFGNAFFVGFGVLSGVLVAVTYEALRVLAERLGAPRNYAALLAVLQVSLVLWMVSTGMEVAIAIPLFAWFLAEVAKDAPLDARRAAKLGGLASLAVLARVDLVLALFLVVGLWLAFVRPWPERPMQAAFAFAAGCVPLAAYFSCNLLFFGGLLPTSGRAKQLGSGLHSSARFAQHVMAILTPGRLLVLCLGSVALMLLLKRKSNTPSAPACVAAVTAIAFPVLFAVLNAVKSDWHVFVWYDYPVIAGLLSASALIVIWGENLLENGRLALVTSAALLAAAALVPVRGALYFARRGVAWADGDNTLLPMARAVAQGLQGHPGRIAMGDKAGITTFLLHRPVVQLEGLVADSALLRHIQRGDSLNAMLAEYGVDYLIVSAAEHPPRLHDGCYDVVAPNPDQAGSSPLMRGKFCAEPMMHFATPASPHTWWHFLALETLVFDLRRERARPGQVIAHYANYRASPRPVR